MVYQEAMGINGVTLPPDPIQQQPTYAGALAAFEQLPPIRVLFDNGAGGPAPGDPQPGFEQSFAELPDPGHDARARGTCASAAALGDSRPARRGADVFTWNAHARPLTDFTRRHRGRRRRPLDGDAAVPVGRSRPAGSARCPT